jgi:hypothetical protein
MISEKKIKSSSPQILNSWVQKIQSNTKLGYEYIRNDDENKPLPCPITILRKDFDALKEIESELRYEIPLLSVDSNDRFDWSYVGPLGTHSLSGYNLKFGRIYRLNMFWESEGINFFPRGILKLDALKVLWFQSEILDFLPDNFGDLISLEKLNFTRCRMMKLPDSIGNLKKLKYLYIQFGECQFENYVKLERFPESFYDLKELKLVQLSVNSFNLSPSILKFKNLSGFKFFLWTSEGTDIPLEIENDVKEMKKLRILNIHGKILYGGKEIDIWAPLRSIIG